MPDIEKVINGLQHCNVESEGIFHNPCNGCPYQDISGCSEQLKNEAIELLKEQQEQKEKWIRDIDLFIKDYERESQSTSNKIEAIYFNGIRRGFVNAKELILGERNHG